MSGRRPRQEDGFALLLVFLLAAGIAISLYMEVPRIAFETQRNREELAVDRGLQYQRAIQLFVRANKRYPTKIEDLESFNNKRYLRHRYVDPLTGKDDWRPVHVGPTGILTDSLVPQQNSNPLAGNGNSSGNNQEASNPASPTGASDSSDPNNDPNAPAGPINFAKVQRPSDKMAGALPPMGATAGPPLNGGDPSQPGAYPSANSLPPMPGQQYPPVYPGTTAGAVSPTGFPPGAVQPGQFPGQPYPPVYPGATAGGVPATGLPPGVVQPGQFPGQQFPGQQFPGQQSPGQQFPGQPAQTWPGQQPAQPYPVQGGAPMQGLPPGFSPGQPNPVSNVAGPGGGFGAGSNAAITAVQNQIFGGSANQSSFANPGQQGGMGAGIAGFGVPAALKGSGIMEINERSKYREWEFIYDPKKDKTVVGAAAAAQNSQAPQAGGLSNGSMFGSTPGSTGATPTAPTPPPPPQPNQ